MKDIVNKGQVLALSIYAFYGLAIIAGTVFDKSGITTVSVITVLFWIISLIVLGVIRMSEIANPFVYNALYITVVCILAVFLQLCFTSIFVVFIVNAILWLTIITFLDKKCFHLTVIIQSLCIIFLAATPRTFSGLKDFNITSLAFSLVGFFLADWVGIIIIDILRRLYEETCENERSLDEMLKIVEAERLKEKEISESKSAFLANMSHELRTPLNATIGFTEMILDKSKDSEVLEYAGNVKASGAMMLSLVNDILDLSKIEANKMTLVPVDFEMGSLIKDICGMVEPKMKEKGLDFTVNSDSSLPEYYHGDDIRLKQILVNLLNNAVKYTAAGSVTLSVSGTCVQNEGHLHFSVKDTGMGIKEKDLSKLNSKFVRLDEEANRNVEGTGLGISIVCNLLRLMDSTLCVDSTYGVGSEFCFDVTLPVTDKTNLKNNDADETAFVAEGMQVLVIDDTPLNLKVITAILKKSKVEVYTATSGQKAIEMACVTKYDVIFIDRMMPGMDGIETLNEMRTIEYFANRDTPIVALTADATQNAKSEYIKLGFDDFLVKPIIRTELNNILRKYWAGNGDGLN